MVIFIACLLIAGFIGTSYMIGTQVAENLVYQNKNKDTHQNSIDQLKEWGYDVSLFQEKYVCSKMSVLSEDKNEVPFYILGANTLTDRNTVILVHGLGGDYASVFPQAEMYLKQGYNVISFDQRASGDSTNEIVSFGYYEQLDIKTLVDYVRERAEGLVIVHGFSMGAATAGIYAGTEHAANNVDAVIMDSPFESMESMLRFAWKEMDTGFPTGYAVWCGDIFLSSRYGFSFEDADVVQSLKSCDIPIFIIQSKKDEISTADMATRLFEAIPTSNKEIWSVDSEHIKGYFDEPEEYTQQVMNFINKV